MAASSSFLSARLLTTSRKLHSFDCSKRNTAAWIEPSSSMRAWINRRALASYDNYCLPPRGIFRAAFTGSLRRPLYKYSNGLTCSKMTLEHQLRCSYCLAIQNPTQRTESRFSAFGMLDRPTCGKETKEKPRREREGRRGRKIVGPIWVQIAPNTTQNPTTRRRTRLSDSTS